MHGARWLLFSLLCLAVALDRRSLAAAMAAGDLFTSSANIHRLFQVEKEVAKALTDLVAEQEARLSVLRSLSARLAAAEAPASDNDLLPSTSFAILKRLTQTLEMIRSTTSQDVDAPFRAMLESAPLPAHEDLVGAAKAMLRLQRTYDPSPQDLMPEAEAEDYIFIGKQAYGQDDMFLAVGWLQAGLAKLNCTLAKDKCVDVLDHLAYARYNLQDYAGALVTSRQLLSLDPHNGRILDNIEFYVAHVADPTLGQDMQLAANVSVPISAAPRYDADNILQHDEKDTSRFRQLCRGRRLYKPKKPLKCYLKHFGKPHLMLNPVKIEVLHRGPARLSVIRDFATPSECAHLREQGYAKLQRAIAWTGGKYQPVEFRISTAGWLEPDHDKVVARIHQRLADATQLDLTYAEALQVSNYGIGGFYETHFDHSKRVMSSESGDRVATFMIYLNNVLAGGNTAFPRMGAFAAPSQGDAAFWYNLLPSGQSDEATLHGGCPVLQGSKWVANKWIHERNNVCRSPRALD